MASTRISQAVEEAARFGSGPDGGVTRLAWEPALFDVYEWLRERAAACGLESRIDPAGNLVIAWTAGEGPAVAVGSHLDTVPDGGRFDGALGVLAGFEALRELKEAGFRPRRPVWLLSFMDEEGSRFGASMFGSGAFVGADVASLGTRTDAHGVSLAEAMATAEFAFGDVGRATAIDRISSYLELHIEQGPVLERSGAEIGIVTGICGLVGLHVRMSGEANHAGTTPMDQRRDALAGAARFVLALRDQVTDRAGCVGTVGAVEVSPGAFNVIPGGAEFTVDLRSAEVDRLDRLKSWAEDTLALIGREEGLEVEIEQIHRLEPTAMASELVDVLSRAAAAEGAGHQSMVSGAGHDAMIVGRHVPAGMFFVPSAGGLSHNPREWTTPEHCDLAVRVLRRALAELAG